MKLKLKLKAYALYWSMTALIAPLIVLLVIVMLLAYHIKFLRDGLGLYCACIAAALLEWRRDTVYWYVTNQKRGYSLDIE